MKKLLRWLAVAAMTSFLASATALGGDCCKQAAKNVRAGKACEQCLVRQCCKDTARKLAKSGKARTCEKCAAKVKKKS